MATWDDVRRIALALPDTEERLSREQRQWRVHDKLFVWERPLRTKEVDALGDSAPDGPIVAARVEHLVAKEAMLADDSRVYFSTSHFDRSATVLARLDVISMVDLEELITEAWLARAPPRLRKAYLD